MLGFTSTGVIVHSPLPIVRNADVFQNYPPWFRYTGQHSFHYTRRREDVALPTLLRPRRISLAHFLPSILAVSMDFTATARMTPHNWLMADSQTTLDFVFFSMLISSPCTPRGHKIVIRRIGMQLLVFFTAFHR